MLLRQLLAESRLDLHLVAGAAGVDRRGPVRWAHISEIPDPTPWLSGGELLLTTGLGVMHSPALQRRLIAGLDVGGCPAIGFGVGIWLDEVPAAMLEEADRRSLPVFTVPYEVPFIAVTRYVARRIFESHDLGLRRALDQHRRILTTVTAGGGLDEVLRITATSLGATEATVFDVFGRVLAQHATGSVPVAVDALRQALSPRPRARRRVEIDGRTATVMPVRAAGDTEAMLVVVSDADLEEWQVVVLDQGATAVAVALSRGESGRRRRRATVGALLTDALGGRATNRAARLADLGLDQDGAYHVLAVAADAAVPVDAVCRMIEDVAADRRVAVGVADDTAYAIVQPADADIGHAVLAVGDAVLSAPPALGRSLRRHGFTHLAVALREAALAADAAAADDGGQVDAAELGVDGLLVGLDDPASARAFVTRVLGPVLAHGDRRATPLIATLRAYLRTGCRPGPAAAQLRVHRHTLAYRLDRIADLTGRDPRDGDHLLAYALALRLVSDGDGAPG